MSFWYAKSKFCMALQKALQWVRVKETMNFLYSLVNPSGCRSYTISLEILSLEFLSLQRRRYMVGTNVLWNFFFTIIDCRYINLDIVWAPSYKLHPVVTPLTTQVHATLYNEAPNIFVYVPFLCPLYTFQCLSTIKIEHQKWLYATCLGHHSTTFRSSTFDIRREK